MTTPKQSTAALTLLALGVVYGDIGTSVLYALRECFSGSHAIDVTPDNVMLAFSGEVKLIDFGIARSDVDATLTSINGIYLAQVAIGTLGVLAITSEYGTGMIRATMAAVRGSRPKKCSRT